VLQGWASLLARRLSAIAPALLGLSALPSRLIQCQAVAPEEFGLIPVTTRAAYEGKHIYQILIERLVRLEHMLIGRGFQSPVPRIQFHLRILERLQHARQIGDDETLWSLVEATELADTYCTLPKLEWRLLKEKFGRVLNGTHNPQQETSESNLARNTMFELHLAGYLNHKGIAADICDNPDILCAVCGRHVFLQCKRPFSRKNIRSNIKGALKQLSCDLDRAGDARNRGVVAVSLTHAINPGEMYLEVRTERDINPAIAGEIRSVGDDMRHLITGPRIIGLAFSATSPVLVRDINEFRTGHVMAYYPSHNASAADRALLRHVFLSRRLDSAPA
jgi:hypothetical protein